MKYTRSEAKQWAQDTIKGFFLCPVTPVNNDFNFDEEGMRKNVEAFIEMGVDGLVVGGFIAECWNATLEEWYRYHEVMAEAVAGRVPLFSIILDPSAYQAVEKMQRLEALGFDGVEVINPVVQLRTDDEIFAWFKFITDRSDMAVVLYRTPVSGKVLGWDLMKRLSDLETVVGAKQGVVSRAESLKLRKILRDDFVLSDPLENVFLDDLRNGGQVVFGELSYILFGKKRHLINDYRALAAEGKWEEAYQASIQLNDIRDFYGDVFLWDVVHTFTYASALASMKCWFEEIGLEAGPIRPPVSQASDELRQRIKTTLKELGVS
ncbi:MAG: dihydrodipicolinate synthase family protein [Immundisolibacteraceae bacterium]|nr:dihydrodipicolinate synthase family protein [Immundisolibacteraceae bacterium]